MSWWKLKKQDAREQARDLAIFYFVFAVLSGLSTLYSANQVWYMPVGWAILSALFAWRAWRHAIPSQFSMQTMMIAITIFAVVMGLFGAVLWRW